APGQARAVQNRGAIGQPHAQRGERQDRAEHHQREQGEHHVEHALEDGAHGSTTRAPSTVGRAQGTSWAGSLSARRRVAGAGRGTPLSRNTAAKRSLSVPAAQANIIEGKSKRLQT